MDTNLAAIINILSQEDMTDVVESPEIDPFEILRKIEKNNLLSVRSFIDDYKIFYSKINEKYKEFDKQGANKSMSVLNVINHEYLRLKGKITDPQELFFAIIENIIDLVKNSRNYVEMPYEELDLCVSVLVVDAFVRCKVFENPEGYHHVTAG
ncbi:MAG: hypothetical protein LUH07_02380 [Lachnospiraceae bacterium]|nr:hypothetical protein [Lachnospiraceae bacterium]